MTDNQIFSQDTYEDMIVTSADPFKSIPSQKEGTWGSGSDGVFTGNVMDSFLTNNDETMAPGTSSVIGEEPKELVWGKGFIDPEDDNSTPGE